MRTPEARRGSREHFFSTTAIISVVLAISTFFYMRMDRAADLKDSLQGEISHIQSQQATDIAKIAQIERTADLLSQNVDSIKIAIEHVSTLLETGTSNGKNGSHR